MKCNVPRELLHLKLDPELNFTTPFLKKYNKNVMHCKLWENKKQNSESFNLQFYSATKIKLIPCGLRIDILLQHVA